MAAANYVAALKLTDYIKQCNLGNVSVNKSDLLSEIKSNYESIFSWEIYETTRKCRMKGTDFLRKIYQKIDLEQNDDRKFNLDLFCLNLISSFEMFSNFEYTQALFKVKDVIRTLRCTQLDTFFDQISDACFHIAYVTQAYIMVHLDFNVQKILTNIKPKSNFNKIEMAAIYGIKSKVFLEYSPEGNDIALDLIESARNFNDKEMLWINIWLKAKRRKRTFDQSPSFPFRDELEAANKLSSNTNLEFVTSAASVYAEAGYTLHLKRSRYNMRESNVYNKLAADLIIIVFHLAKNNIKLLYYCLSCINNLPINFISKRIIYQIVNKLKMQENYRIQNTLGKFYFKNKDFKTARDYFKKSSRSFSSSLMLIKVECLLSSVDSFPVVQYLRLLYTSCNGSKKKRYISTQILLYYMYNENDNKKELLYCLDNYLNEHIDFVLKKNYISEIYPLFRLKKTFNKNTFIEEVGNIIEELETYPNWNFTEKNILNRVVLKFGVMSNSEKIDDFIDSEMSCVVCQFHKAYCILRPCGHRCVCKSCWTSLRNNNNLCPMCRTVVRYYLIST